ncbi:hypothetical protein [Chamaesiphon sp. VAR_48_metabat_135_sub]|uniref:hypothetical protein n=1 Tax=Chamaesiphon sp. VAR_48_metabat_135_sub TaxID=2964699 RepID=UPI00286D4C52|nr:hypothetical protein [Chamaesiphon sp. VAR_48_metabat_135_sub]
MSAKKGDRKLALADLDLAIASEPKFASAYIERATLSEQSGDSPEERLAGTIWCETRSPESH